MLFHLIRAKGCPVVALPTEPRAALAGIGRINAFTPKRWALKHALRIATYLGAHSIYAETVADPLGTYAGIDTRELLEVIGTLVGGPPESACIIWPWPPDVYRGRVYIHVFNEEGVAIGFTKLVFSADQVNQIRNEAEVLLGTPYVDGVKVPRLLGAGPIENGYYITVEPLPDGIKSVSVKTPFPRSEAERIAGPVSALSMERVQLLPWWDRVASAASQCPGLLHEVQRLITIFRLRVRRVHGDFSQKNIVKCGTDMWIVDWEAGAIQGPHLVDEVAYFLFRRNVDCRKSPAAVLGELYETFTTSDPRTCLDVDAALCYLSAFNPGEAGLLLPYWKPRRGGRNR